MKRLLTSLMVGGLLVAPVLGRTAHAGAPLKGHALSDGEVQAISVSSFRMRGQTPSKEDPGNIHLEGEIMNRTSVSLVEVEIRVTVTAPDSGDIEVDRRIHVPYEPAIEPSASELLSRSLILPEAIKETLSKRALAVSVVGATAAGE